MENGQKNLEDSLSSVHKGRGKMNNMIDLYCAAGTVATTYAVSSSVGQQDPWVHLVISMISAIFFGVVSVFSKVITAKLVSKGIITEEQKKEIDSKTISIVEDVMDDGKINNSNLDK